METKIIRRTTARIVSAIFHNSTSVNIRHYQVLSVKDIKDYEIDKKYDFEICIRHNEEEDPTQLFFQGLKDIEPERPYQYFILNNTTKEVIRGTNVEPRADELFTWEPTEDPRVKEKKLTRTAYVDTRYKARLRLFNYIHSKLD